MTKVLVNSQGKVYNPENYTNRIKGYECTVKYFDGSLMLPRIVSAFT